MPSKNKGKIRQVEERGRAGGQGVSQQAGTPQGKPRHATLDLRQGRSKRYSRSLLAKAASLPPVRHCGHVRGGSGVIGERGRGGGQGGFSEDMVKEDIALSIGLHEAKWVGLEVGENDIKSVDRIFISSYIIFI